MFTMESEVCETPQSTTSVREGVHQLTVVYPSNLPCKKMGHDQQTKIRRDTPIIQSGISNPVAHLDTPVQLDSPPENNSSTVSYIFVPISIQNEKEPVVSTPPSPIVIQPVRSILVRPQLCQTSDVRNNTSICTKRKTINPSSSRNAQLLGDTSSANSVKANTSRCTKIKNNNPNSSRNSQVQADTPLANKNKQVSKQQHAVTKTFKCSICSKLFEQKQKLLRHLPTHTGVEPFMCIKCGKELTSIVQLSRHQKNHDKIKPYKCVVCGLSFVQAVKLRSHQRMHKEKGPWKCTGCEKEFLTRRALAMHQQEHNA